jgi:hypothetical protein
MDLSTLEDEVRYAVHFDPSVDASRVAKALARKFGVVPVAWIDDEQFWKIVREHG